MKAMLALLTSALVGVGCVACGGASPPRTPSTTGSIATAASAHARHSGRYIFGDYDRDDYYGDTSDNDNDDRAEPMDGDGDFDNAGNGYYDGDDGSVRAFGHAASAADRRAITTLVESYYAAAAAGDGRKACSLTYPTIAAAIPEDLGENGPPYLHGGKTCAAIMSKLFELNRLRLATYAAKLEVTGVRLVGDHGFAVLGFETLPGRQIAVERDRSVWKIEAVTDSELP